jgi:phage terminase large subunit GpA-like protein
MQSPDEYYYAQANAAADLLSATTDEHVLLSPSEWAETKRYLPSQTTARPGPFSWDPTPYWREPLDCMSQDSPIHFVAIQKGAQVAATVGVLENVIGYYAEHVRTMPILFFTADDGLAKLRMDTNIVPMFQHSGFDDVIQSNDTMRKGKQGLTNTKIEWAGGGFLIPLGAINDSKQRSLSAPILLRDEGSGWPLKVGKEGSDPFKTTETRTNSYELTRKVLDLSTPTTTGTCAISKRFKMGDQRYYNVPCVHCGEKQVLRFRGTNPETGLIYGLTWDTETTDSGPTVKAGSVRYTCQHCSREMVNEHKALFMEAGEWVPTATPSQPDFRSYHISAMYAPSFARTWEAIARAWVEAWDDVENRPKDIEKLQVFYNNDLGEPFEARTNKLKSHQISAHKRASYRSGELPMLHAQERAGGPIEIVTMAVDVQEKWLAVKVMAWAPSADNAGYNAYMVEYIVIEGDCTSPDSQAWVDLAEIIDHKMYTAGGRDFRIAITMVDASYESDTVYTFCGQWEVGVYPLRGRDKPLKGARIKEFDMMQNATGTRYCAVTVDLYKDRWSHALARQWNGIGTMPRNNWSAPGDIEDKTLNHLTVEYKCQTKDPKSGKVLGTYWHRPNNARQELWDLLIYNTAALEMVAYDVCEQHAGIEALVWPEFWALAKEGMFWSPSAQ